MRPSIRSHCGFLAALWVIGCTSATQPRPATAPPPAVTASDSKSAAQASRPKPKKKKKPKQKPKPKPPKDEVATAAKPAAVVQPPQPEDSRIVLPVTIAFDALVAQIDALVPQTEQQDWTQITKGNESPKAEVKYQLWRDPIKVAFSDHTFHITVPVHYAANVRAQVKNPFSKRDWISIAKNETWGTREDPQHLTATIDAEIGIDGAWQIKSKIRLDDLQHGEPPSGKICKKAVIQICMSKADVAPKVRKGIDAYLRPRLQEALARVEAQVQSAFDLQARAQSVWAALQAPAPIPLPGTDQRAWLIVQPTAVGVGQLEQHGADLRIDLSIAGRIAVLSGAKPKRDALPLPELSAVDGPAGFHVKADLRLPTDLLSKTLNQQLKGLRFGGEGDEQLSIAGAQVLTRVDEQRPHRMVVKLALAGALQADIELYGELAYDAARQRLSVEHFDFTVASKGLLTKALDDFDHAAMRKKLASKAHWDLAAASSTLSDAIATALNATARDQLRVSGALTQLEVKDYAMRPDALTAAVILGGALQVHYTPRAAE